MTPCDSISTVDPDKARPAADPELCRSSGCHETETTPAANQCSRHGSRSAIAAPAFSTLSIVTGRVAALELVENARS